MKIEPWRTRKVKARRSAAAILGIFATCSVASSPAVAQTSGGYADNWTGLYVGAGVGLGAAKFKNEASASTYSSTLDGYTGWGGLASLYAGYDRHVGSGVIVGLMAGYDRFKAASGSTGLTPSTEELSQQQSARSQMSLGARLGYAASADAMWFVSAGLAWTTVGYRETSSFSLWNIDKRGDVSGYFIGAGGEVRLGGGLYLNSEYRISSFDGVRVVKPFDRPSVEIETMAHQARLGLSYKFGDNSGSASPAASQAAMPIGLYLGVSAGGGVFGMAETSSYSDSSVFRANGRGGDGGLLGLIGGIDFRLSQHFVLGLFGDVEGRDWSHRYRDSGGWVIEQKLGSAWSAGGRLGYLVGPSTLLFLSAGYTRADFGDLNFIPPWGNVMKVRSYGQSGGYFLGGGLETMLTSALALRGEYRFNHHSEHAQPIVDSFTGAQVGKFQYEPWSQTGKLSLVYRLDTFGK